MAALEDEHEDKKNATKQFFANNGGGVLEIGKRKFAVGLLWGISDSSVKKSALDFIGKNGGTSYCQHGDFQFGVGHEEVGHKPGMFSLAATIANTLTGNIVAMYVIDKSQWYLVAIRNGQILADCDRLFTDGTEAINAFSELFYGEEWDVKIAPAAWDMPETKEVILEDAVSSMKGAGKLKALSNRKLVMQILLATMICGGGYYAYTEYTDYQQAEYARQQALLHKKKPVVVKKEQKEVIPPAPWLGKRQGIPTLEVCVNGILSANIDVAGWKADSLSCDGSHISLTLKRDGGTINWIGVSLNREGFKPAVMARGDGNEASVSWPLANPAGKISPDIRPQKASDVRRYLISHMEESFQKITFKEGSSNMYFNTLEFTFHTEMSPNEYKGLFEKIVGLSFTRIMLKPDINHWTWTIEGNVYEKLQ